MKDLFKLILDVLASLFKSRAKLEAEILILRQQITCFAGGHRNDGTSTIPIVFCLFGFITGSPLSMANSKITLRLASGTDRGNGTAKRSDQGQHGQAAVRQIFLLECCH